MRLPEKRKNQNNSTEIREFSFEKNYKLVYLTVATFFLGNIICVLIGFNTIISIFSFIKVLAAIVFVSWAVQNYFFRSIFLMKSMEYLMVAIFGLAPILMALFLSLNYFIYLEENTATYKLKRVISQGDYQYYRVDGIPCEEFPELCVEHEDNIKLRKGNFVEITLAKGLFGFETIAEIKEIPK